MAVNNFDSIKFQVPLKYLSSISSNFFDRTLRTREKIVTITDKNILNTNSDGLKNIIIDNTQENCTIEISAKILYDNYFSLINKKTISEVFYNLKKLKIIKFKDYDLLNNSKVLKIDVTRNIPVQSSVKEYVTNLSIVPIASKFSVTRYKDESLVITKNPLSRREKLRCIFYNKMSELLKDKSFCKNYSVLPFDNILRFEINFMKFNLIRKHFNINNMESLTLQKLLDSDVNISSNYFEEIKNSFTGNKKVYDLITNYKTLHDAEKFHGMYGISESFNFDFILVSRYIRNMVKGNVSNYLRQYEEICSSGLNKIYKNSNSSKYVDEISNYLKVA